ncbi:uncharacterized protein LOC126386432 [Epinephelus moara]|uniref:uncharacterized protein LOC126386432 n=1 Tax=Epinephelus moara TaxID=300413 RepID=UPI00214F59BC|nr:uncharacterized protein LOC126386432 [Epinephelus moara]
MAVLPDIFHVCHNLQSALAELHTVDTLLAKDVKEGFMIGLFDIPHFLLFRISPIGVATRKYSGKKRLIMDLSSPHGSHIPSINSVIPSPDFSIQYATIDHAITLIRLAGRGAWLSKADITSAFKVLPIHPDFWRFFGACWKGAYYFSVRLTFGCKSSPKIFDSLSEALCWILTNNHRFPYILHLLNDFLVVSPPSSPPCHGLNTLTNALLLSNYLLADRCTKRQLLALLGHLNYAIRIIPQAKSFLSILLSKAAAIPSLHDRVILDDACKMEMCMRLHFLSSWNGISFFYDDFITQPEDIQLFTDTAPSTGFGGYYGGRWFASIWPPESRSPSSALHELYPIIIAAILWGHEWSRKSILIHSDNTTVVEILNKGRSCSLAIMQFLRRLTLFSAQHQFILWAAHIPGHHNSIADSLSRFSFQKFRHLAPESDLHPTPIPPFSATIFS